jgi:hypothetical protein
MTFKVGEVYYGTLACAHSDFPVRVVKRTEKTVWFEHATMPQHYSPAKSRARIVSESKESCRFHGWSIWSDKTTGGDWDMQFV